MSRIAATLQHAIKAYVDEMETTRLVVLESGLGLESGLESVLRGLGLGLGLELEGLGLGLGLDDSGLDLLSSPYGSPAKKNSRAL